MTDSPAGADIRRITVLHVNTERGWRGGERQVLLLAAGQARAGQRAIVVARRGEPLAERASRAGLETVTIAPVFELDPFAIASLRRTARAERAAIVHAHTAHATTLGAAATIGATPRLVVTRRAEFALRRNPVTRWKYSRAEGVIAISDAVARSLAGGGIPASRIDVIPDGIDLARSVSSATRATLAALGVPATGRLVVQVAALTREKDPLTFVRALAIARERVPDAHGLMVGAGPLREEIETAAREMGLTGVLHLAGHRDDADEIIAAADVVTLTSTHEGLGSVLLDAMSLGRPIVATAAGGIPDLVTHGKTGLVTPVGEARSLGEGIARLLTERELAGRLAAAGRERVMEYSIDRIVERTARVYRRVLGR